MLSSSNSSSSATGRAFSIEITCHLNRWMYLSSLSLADSAESAHVVTFMKPLVSPEGMSPGPARSSATSFQIRSIGAFSPDSCVLLFWSLQHRRSLSAGLGAWHRFGLPCGRISRRIGIHAEVPNVEVHFFCVQHFDERIFAWHERL